MSYTDGGVHGNLSTDIRIGVYPTLFLNSNIKIIADENHNGSEEHPYELKLAS